MGGEAKQPRRTGVLVVDDEPSICLMLDAGLTHYGYAVWTAVTGLEAFHCYKTHRTSIDVVLLDVRMPGWDGPRTLAALQEVNPNVCCFFISGEMGSYSEAALLHLGARGLILKPFGPFHVASILSQAHLGQRGVLTPESLGNGKAHCRVAGGGHAGS